MNGAWTLALRRSAIAAGTGFMCCSFSVVQRDTAQSSCEEPDENQCPERQIWRPKVSYPRWDYNWDGNMTEQTTYQALKAANGKHYPGVTRHIILIRHGQYDETYEDDEKRKLTELGRAQAEETGKRLAELAKGIDEKFGSCNIRLLRVSGMTRAKETAEIISRHLPSADLQDPDPALNEGIPAQIIPVRPEINSEKEYDKDHNRIEDAFQKYMYRVPSDQNESDQHDFEVIVAHGNLIRYFMCRALQLPPEAWLRFSVFNCSLTYLMIKPNGTVSCRLLGDVGHLGYDLTTFSMNHGFRWS